MKFNSGLARPINRPFISFMAKSSNSGLIVGRCGEKSFIILPLIVDCKNNFKPLKQKPTYQFGVDAGGNPPVSTLCV
jgi:hypothetical protein